MKIMKKVKTSQFKKNRLFFQFIFSNKIAKIDEF